jgi:DNA mismatch repair protein MutL
MGHVNEAFTRIALAYDNVHFTLSHNDRTVHDLPVTGNWRERIAMLFGAEVAESLLFVETKEGPIRYSGYVANPSQNRANNRMQYLFLNRRHIRDRALSHALSEAYRGLLMVGRYAICFLRLEMPPDAVDVNVHPTKLEVRFRDGGEVYARLLQMLRTRFLSTNLTARVPPPDHAANVPDPRPAAVAGHDALPPFRPFDASGTPGYVSPLPTRQDRFALDFGQQAATTREDVPRQTTAGSNPDVSTARQPDWPTSGPAEDSASRESMRDDSVGGEFIPRESAESMSPAPARVVSAEGTPAMQVYDRYLITESDEGVVVIDQHALHERILYEELREKVLSQAVEVQRLLVPEPVTLTPSEKAVILDGQEHLSQLGIEVESFGGDTVLISAYPAMLANISPTDLLRGIVEQLMTPEKSPQRRDTIDSLLHMISCKAAIKAGDRLTADEIATLIQRRHAVQDSHHCPHGRPTTLVFSREQLDRMFGRT